MDNGYPNIPSLLCPVPYEEELPIPVPPESYTLDSDDDHDDDQDSAGPEPSADPDFELPHSSPELHLISQSELNDLELPRVKQSCWVPDYNSGKS